MNILHLALHRVKRIFQEQERTQDSIHLLLLDDQRRALNLQEELDQAITDFIDQLEFDQNLKEALHQYYICCFLGGSELELVIDSDICVIKDLDSLIQCLNNYLVKL